MPEPSSTDSAGLRDRLRADPFGLVAAGSVLLLCALVAVVGAIAVLAETVGTWQALFFMERTMAVAVPAVKGLLVLSLVAGVGLVVRTD